jgi:hypothetical protein
MLGQLEEIRSLLADSLRLLDFALGAGGRDNARQAVGEAERQRALRAAMERRGDSPHLGEIA